MSTLHLTAMGLASSTRSLCGLKDPLPVCGVAFADIHGRHTPLCRECADAAGITPPVVAGANQLDLFGEPA